MLWISRRKKLFLLQLLYFFVNFSLLAESPGWSLTNVDSGWNTKALIRHYFHHSEMQRQWAWELMGLISFRGDESILDFGSGDGKITAEIARLLPRGKIVGADISSEMIDFAKQRFPIEVYPNLSFRKINSLDFSRWPIQEKYDLVISFCVFHLVPNPQEVLKNLKKHLKDGSKLLLVIPCGDNPPFFEAAEDTFKKYRLVCPWVGGPPQEGTKKMRTMPSCRAHLEEAGFSVCYLNKVDLINPFFDKEELVNWMIGTLAANWNIPEKLIGSFFFVFAVILLEKDPNVQDEKGHISFRLSRLHVIAEAI